MHGLVTHEFLMGEFFVHVATNIMGYYVQWMVKIYQQIVKTRMLKYWNIASYPFKFL